MSLTSEPRNDRRVDPYALAAGDGRRRQVLVALAVVAVLVVVALTAGATWWTSARPAVERADDLAIQLTEEQLLAEQAAARVEAAEQIARSAPPSARTASTSASPRRSTGAWPSSPRPSRPRRAERTAQLDQRQAQLDAREQELTSRETRLTSRSAELDARTAELDAREQAIARREAALEAAAATPVPAPATGTCTRELRRATCLCGSHAPDGCHLRPHGAPSVPPSFDSGAVGADDAGAAGRDLRELHQLGRGRRPADRDRHAEPAGGAGNRRRSGQPADRQHGGRRHGGPVPGPAQRRQPGHRRHHRQPDEPRRHGSSPTTRGWSCGSTSARCPGTRSRAVARAWRASPCSRRS